MWIKFQTRMYIFWCCSCVDFLQGLLLLSLCCWIYTTLSKGGALSCKARFVQLDLLVSHLFNCEQQLLPVELVRQLTGSAGHGGQAEKPYAKYILTEAAEKFLGWCVLSSCRLCFFIFWKHISLVYVGT